VRVAVSVLLVLCACGRIDFDARSDAGAPGDANGDGQATGDAGPTVYGDFTDVAAWSAFDITTVTAGAGGYVGAAFDGRYTYYVPSYYGGLHGIVARHDTQGSFTDAASWATFDTTTIATTARGFNGGVFDGRYVYFVPHENLSGFNGVITRYDTQQAFTQAAAWETFDTATVNARNRGFYGARFDGRYLYLVPYQDTVIARYDTQAAFASGSSWTTFDLSTVSASVGASVGAAFDGRYLYLVPTLTSVPSGLVLRFDTQGTMTSVASWSTFDTKTLAPAAAGYAGAGFDGRYLYLTPLLSTTGGGYIAARYDTQAAFATAASWEIFDTRTVNTAANGLMGATFDGRFIYFAPYVGVAAVRFDTTAGAFNSAAAWSSLDLRTVNAAAIQFYGATFDGSAVYFVPHGGSTAVRFSAKTPPSMPQVSGFGGSFL
jgi:hypothetical protein